MWGREAEDVPRVRQPPLRWHVDPAQYTRPQPSHEAEAAPRQASHIPTHRLESEEEGTPRFRCTPRRPITAEEERSSTPVDPREPLDSPQSFSSSSTASTTSTPVYSSYRANHKPSASRAQDGIRTSSSDDARLRRYRLARAQQQQPFVPEESYRHAASSGSESFTCAEESPNTRRRTILGPYHLLTRGDGSPRQPRRTNAASTQPLSSDPFVHVKSREALPTALVAQRDYHDAVATEKRGRGRGAFHPDNAVMYNGLVQHVPGRRGASDDTAGAALYHRYNRPRVEAIRAYRAGVALATGIDPAAARDRHHYVRRSSGWRTKAGGEGGDSGTSSVPPLERPVGPQYVSVGQRLAIREPAAAAPLPLQEHSTLHDANQLRGRWTWSRVEPERDISKGGAFDRPGEPPFTSSIRNTPQPHITHTRSTQAHSIEEDEGLARSPPMKPSAATARQLRQTLLGSPQHPRGPRAPPTATTSRDIMEAALAARFGASSGITGAPSAIEPARYRGTQAAGTGADPRASAKLPHRNTNAHDNLVMDVDESDAAEIVALSRNLHPASRSVNEPALWLEEGKEEDVRRLRAQEARRLLLFPPMLTPLLEEVNQCLYEHQLGSLLEIWRADPVDQDRVLASVGFTPREREIILWELARMIRNTSTSVAVAI